MPGNKVGRKWKVERKAEKGKRKRNSLIAEKKAFPIKINAENIFLLEGKEAVKATNVIKIPRTYTAHKPEKNICLKKGDGKKHLCP